MKQTLIHNGGINAPFEMKTIYVCVVPVTQGHDDDRDVCANRGEKNGRLKSPAGISGLVVRVVGEFEHHYRHVIRASRCSEPEVVC